VLQPLHLALVRTSRLELSFSRDSLLLRDLRETKGEPLQSIRFLAAAAGDWTRGIDGRINAHVAGGARRPHQRKDPLGFEDKIEGFVREPFEEIAKRSGVDVDLVMARIAAMLRAGTIRRVRQTLLATNLADGALVAWKVPEDKIDDAFDWMFQRDPFSGHVVLRSTDTVTAGSDYKLWTTVKVPHGFSLQQHCELLSKKVGAERFD
jgi:hypothetical protein